MIQNLYPWLQKTYKKIIVKYQIYNKNSLSCIIQTIPSIGTSLLLEYIAYFVMCNNKKINLNKFYHCNHCHGCKLIFYKNHPDIYYLNSKYIGIEEVRNVIEKIYYYSQQGNKKIIFIKADFLTPESSNALLKTIEEPPINTLFFITTYNFKNLFPTLLSRCYKIKLFIPTLEISLPWIKNNTFNKNINLEKCIIALRINYMSPILALKFINYQWENRKIFCDTLYNFLENKNFLIDLLTLFNKEDILNKINWFCSLFLDAIKFNLGLHKYLYNKDQKKLIKKIFYSISIKNINFILNKMFFCYQKILISNFKNIKEIIILEQLLILEKLIISH